MASDHAYTPAPAPPPSPRLPPPPSSPHPSHLQAPQISPRRFAVQPPLLNTTLAPPQPSGPAYLHGSTPVTASSLSLPFSPSLTPSTYAPSPVAAASPMAMRGSGPAAPYNPQQWSRGGSVNGQHLQHSQVSAPSRLHDVTGMEGIHNLSSSLSSDVLVLCNVVDPVDRLSLFSLLHPLPKHATNPVSSTPWHCTFPLHYRGAERVKACDANGTSLDAFPPTSIFAWAEPKHLAVPEHQQHFVASALRQHVSTSSPSSTAHQQSVLCATHLRLPQSAHFHGYTLECDQRNIKPTVPTPTTKKRSWSFLVPRQTDCQVQPFVL